MTCRTVSDTRAPGLRQCAPAEGSVGHRSDIWIMVGRRSRYERGRNETHKVAGDGIGAGSTVVGTM